MSLRDRARAWARTILERAWTPERFRLELTKETIPTHRSLRRPIYRAELSVWEHTGVAVVTLDRGGRVRGVRYPVAADDLPEREEVELERVPDAAIRAALAAASPSPKVQVRDAARAATKDGVVLALTLEQRPPDGAVVIELDPASGAELGYSAEPFLRGSTRSAALSRTAAVTRARAAIELPDGARLVRAELVVTTNGARVWRLRWRIDAAPGEATGFVRALLNARSGVVAGLLREIRPPLDDHARPPREAAQRRLDVFVQVRFGDGADASPLVPGATKVGDAYVPAWLSVITTPRGSVIRATLVGERVELSKPGRREPTRRSA